MDQSTETTTIYIRLLEEATTCSRPTEAVAMPDGSYEVLATPDYDPTDEVWEFVPGSRVHCATVDGPSGPHLLAVTAVADKLPNFHDGHFDGLWIGPNELVHVFLTTVDRKPFILELEGVKSMALTEVKQGNIILDLAIRSADELTPSDIQNVYGSDASSPQVSRALAAAKAEKLQILEINPSYGAEGTILFKSWKLIPRVAEPGQSHALRTRK